MGLVDGLCAHCVNKTEIFRSLGNGKLDTVLSVYFNLESLSLKMYEIREIWADPKTATESEKNPGCQWLWWDL